jgi:hypothetical protein
MGIHIRGELFALALDELILGGWRFPIALVRYGVMVCENGDVARGKLRKDKKRGRRKGVGSECPGLWT